MNPQDYEATISRITKRLAQARFEATDCPEIEGHKPDVFGVRRLPARRVMKAAVAIETSLSLEAPKAAERMQSFAAWSSAYKSRKTMLFIPAGMAKRAKEVLPEFDEYYEF